MAIDVPATVTFDGSDSSDPDGTIRAYEWSFSDGETRRGPTVTRRFGRDDTGNIQATLTVTDDDNATDTDSETITLELPENDQPTAIATASTTSASPPVTITFTGSESSDPDGSITGYSWDIPGKPPQEGEEVAVEFTDADIGEYDVTLTVRDNRGGTATDTVSIQIAEQQIFPDISDETLAQGAIVGVGVISSTLVDNG